MKVHTYEKAYIISGVLVLVACAAALVYATFGLGIHLPGVAGRIDPQRVDTTAPFDQPGLRQTGPNQYELVVIGRIWRFQPDQIRVPQGAEVTIIATTSDVIHGLSVTGTRVNMMLVPGQISRNTFRFDQPGEHLIICHEYCGIGHHTMAGSFIVEPRRTARGAVDDGAINNPTRGGAASHVPRRGER